MELNYIFDIDKEEYNIVRDENKSELLWMRDGVRVICQEGQSEIEFAALSYTKNLKKKNEMKLK